MKEVGFKLLWLFPSLTLANWFLIAGSAAFVAGLRSIGMEHLTIFLSLWILNIVLCGLVIILNDKTKTDITLMEGLQRLTKELRTKSSTLGRIAETIIVIRLVIWDGADRFIIYFGSRVPRLTTKIIVLIIVSGLQMGLWSYLYSAGYDSLYDFLTKKP